MIWIKAQSSFEIIFAISIVFLVLLLMTQFMLAKQKDKENLENFLESRLACEAFSNEVQNVFLLGNGTKSAIKTGRDLNISHGVIVSGSVLCIACCNLTMNGSAVFSITAGTILIQNKNGDIIV